MKVIFLDIDGVLATILTGYDCFDFVCVHHLNRILTEVPDARIVMSSTWRLGLNTLDLVKYVMFDGRMMFFREGLSQDNQLLAERTIGRTDRLHGHDRGVEIDDWLKRVDGRIDVESFVILDDDSDMNPHMDRLVQTDAYYGLSFEDTNKAIEILNG